MKVSQLDWDGRPFYALTDSFGCIVTLYELLEILTAIKPFYDTIPDSTVEEFNEWESERRVTPGGQGNNQKKNPAPRSRPGFVYVLQSGPYYKIGLSRQVDSRIKQLACLPPFDLELICTIAAADMYQLERELQARFETKWRHGEWFELDPADVDYIKGLGEGKKWTQT
jgi:hypothetical protein